MCRREEGSFVEILSGRTWVVEERKSQPCLMAIDMEGADSSQLG